MKLKSKIIHHSSIVGGGLMLADEKGVAQFVVNFIGVSNGINKEQSEALSEQIDALINAHGLSVPAAEPPDNSLASPDDMGFPAGKSK